MVYYFGRGNCWFSGKNLMLKKRSLIRAVDLGIAMQLTNIARDVVEDEKKIEFIYLVIQKIH